jgi:hypothetical protein
MSKLIKDQDKLFSYIDSNFKNWNIDEGVETKKRKLETKILEKDGKFTDFLKEKDVLTQEEVIKYVEEYKQDFNYTHFFLLKNSEGKFFVASVHVDDDGRLDVRVSPLEYDVMWHANYQHRVVVPQLDSKTLKTKTLGNLDTLLLRVEELEDFKSKVEKDETQEFRNGCNVGLKEVRNLISPNKE